MDKKIKEQILAIRDTGETNMFDVRKVQGIALREGFKGAHPTFPPWR